MAPNHAYPIVVAALALALAGCGGSSTSAGTTSAATTTETTAATTTTETAATETTTPTAATTAAAPTTITIHVVGGKPDGGIARPTVAHDERVVIVVQSDTADEVHVHGYDIMKDVAAGGTIRIPFDATIRGRFVVELENTGVELAEITVS